MTDLLSRETDADAEGDPGEETKGRRRAGVVVAGILVVTMLAVGLILALVGEPESGPAFDESALSAEARAQQEMAAALNAPGSAATDGPSVPVPSGSGVTRAVPLSEIDGPVPDTLRSTTSADPTTTELATTAAPTTTTTEVPTTTTTAAPTTTTTEPPTTTTTAAPTTIAPTTTAAPTTTTTAAPATTTTAPPSTTTEAPTTTTTAAPTTTTEAPNTNAVLSIATVNGDMTGSHEGKLSGVPSGYSWAGEPERLAPIPSGYGAAVAWGHIYEQAGGSPSKNTRVEVRNLRLWSLSKSTGKWKLVQSSTDVEGRAFLENYRGNDSIAINTRTEDGGGTSTIPGDGRNFHFWTSSGRSTLRSDDVAGIVVAIDTRTVLDDPKGVDDRAKARFLVGVSADLWRNKSVSWHDDRPIGVGLGKMRFATPDWRVVTMTTLTAKQLAANPPPF